jgi:probable phosphoglycerate mutase
VKVHVGLALGAATDALFRMELQPASLSEIQWYPGGPTCLRLFNDTAHLSGLS